MGYMEGVGGEGQGE